MCDIKPCRVFFTVMMLLCFSISAVAGTSKAFPRMEKHGTATQLIVDNKPWIMLGGELHNSSASGLEYMETLWPRLKALNLNTVIASVSWELIEPEEGHFDFSMIDGIIKQARQNDMRLIFLWFGSWKNGVSSYCPGWVLKDTKRFPRCKGSSNRNTKDIITPLSKANLDADAKAFVEFMRHLRKVDDRQNTVIMIQVENEVGIKPETRDLSELGDSIYNSAVPAALMNYLEQNRKQLVPELLANWEKAGGNSSGTWKEVFGEGFQSEEIFSAWHYASYINEIIIAGRKEYPLPMYVNAWLRAPDWKPGHYPVGGPLAHMMDIWKAAAPNTALLAPDIYLPDFKGVCAEYTQQNNPLLIPEASTDREAAARVFWAIAEHDAIGFAPFGIDHVDPEQHLLDESYTILGQLLPMIAEHQGTDRLAGIYQQDRTQERPEKPIEMHGYRANVSYNKRRPGNDAAFGLLLQSGDDEFIAAGWGFDVNFSATTPGPRSTGILSVELGHFEKDKWISEMRLNGDETGANYVAKLPPNFHNTYLDPMKPMILKIRVYRYD